MITMTPDDFKWALYQKTKFSEPVIVTGSMCITDKRITHLPPNLQIDGTLSVTWSGITKLSDELTVWILNLVGSKIKVLKNVAVRDYISFDKKFLIKYPYRYLPLLATYKGKLRCQGMPEMEIEELIERRLSGGE